MHTLWTISSKKMTERRWDFGHILQVLQETFGEDSIYNTKVRAYEDSFEVRVGPSYDLWIDSDVVFIVDLPNEFPKGKPSVRCSQISEAIRLNERLLVAEERESTEFDAADYISSDDEAAPVDNQALPAVKMIPRVDETGKVILNMFDKRLYVGWLTSYRVETIIFSLRLMFRKSDRELAPRRGWSTHKSGPFPVSVISAVHEEQGPRDSMEDMVCAVDEHMFPKRGYSNRSTPKKKSDVEGAEYQDSDESDSENNANNISFHHNMDDCHVVSLHGVFDGHGGSYAAQIVADLFQYAYFDALVKDPEMGIEHALYTSLLDTDEQALSTLVAKGDSSGTTGCVVSIDLRQGIVCCANVGDSRAVMSRDGVAVPLSVDHKADKPEEIARVVHEGGFVANGRILGMLAVGRALGDHELKRPNRFVNSMPDVRSFQLTYGDEFIVVACDGIYDVMSSQEVVDYVRDKFRLNMDILDICKHLVRHALKVLHSMDNVTVIIIDIHAERTTQYTQARQDHVDTMDTLLSEDLDSDVECTDSPSLVPVMPVSEEDITSEGAILTPAVLAAAKASQARLSGKNYAVPKPPSDL